MTANQLADLGVTTGCSAPWCRVGEDVRLEWITSCGGKTLLGRLPWLGEALHAVCGRLILV